MKEAEIHLRKVLPDDANALYAAIHESKQELSAWLSWCHPTYQIEDTIAWIHRVTRQTPIPAEYEFVIVDGSNRLVGACGLNRLDALNRTGNLGYWIRTSETGRGLATESVRQLTRWAFTETSLHRIEILVAVGNLPSCRVAEKAGATCESVLRSRLWSNGQSHDAMMYSLLRDRTTFS